MKKTILNNIHKKLGAKMGVFAGYEMPIQYSGVKNEHLTVRNNVGIFADYSLAKISFADNSSPGCMSLWKPKENHRKTCTVYVPRT